MEHINSRPYCQHCGKRVQLPKQTRGVKQCPNCSAIIFYVGRIGTNTSGEQFLLTDVLKVISETELYNRREEIWKL